MDRKVIAVALAIAIAMPAEGLRQRAYYDPPGILTVCWGHTGPDVVRHREYSMEECKKFITADMREAVEQVERCHPGLPPKILAAFGDAVFNIGPTVACNSTASKYLDKGEYVRACNELPRWNKAKVAGVYVELPGLTTRRHREKKLCLEGAK